MDKDYSDLIDFFEKYVRLKVQLDSYQSILTDLRVRKHLKLTEAEFLLPSETSLKPKSISSLHDYTEWNDLLLRAQQEENTLSESIDKLRADISRLLEKGIHTSNKYRKFHNIWFKVGDSDYAARIDDTKDGKIRILVDLWERVMQL